VVNKEIPSELPGACLSSAVAGSRAWSNPEMISVDLLALPESRT